MNGRGGWFTAIILSLFGAGVAAQECDICNEEDPCVPDPIFVQVDQRDFATVHALRLQRKGRGVEQEAPALAPQFRILRDDEKEAVKGGVYNFFRKCNAFTQCPGLVVPCGNLTFWTCGSQDCYECSIQAMRNACNTTFALNCCVDPDPASFKCGSEIYHTCEWRQDIPACVCPPLEEEPFYDPWKTHDKCRMQDCKNLI